MDSIGNGVQVLQAANTGITSLQSLIANAQSIANQVLQAPTGYSTKSTVTSAAITGATANNLLGTGTAATSGTVTAGAFTTLDVAGTRSAATAAAPITGGAFTALDVGTGSVAFSLNVDGTTKSITIDSAAITAFTGAGGTLTGSRTALSAADVAGIIDYQVNNTDTTGAGPVTVNAGALQIASATTGTASQLAITGYTATGVTSGSTGLANVTLETGSAATSADSQAFTVTVDGGSATSIKINAANVAAYNTAKSTSLSASSLSATDVANLINYQDSSTVASVVGGKLTFTSGTSGTSSSVAVTAVTGTATSGSTGIVAATNTGAAAAPGGLSGETLTIAATDNGRRQPASPSAPAPARFRRSTSSIRRWQRTTCRPASIPPV